MPSVSLADAAGKPAWIVRQGSVVGQHPQHLGCGIIYSSHSTRAGDCHRGAENMGQNIIIIKSSLSVGRLPSIPAENCYLSVLIPKMFFISGPCCPQIPTL